MKTIVNFLKKNWPFFAIGAIIIGIVFVMYNSGEKNRIQAEIDAIDTQIGGGRSSANDTVDLYNRKKALLVQLKKLY